MKNLWKKTSYIALLTSFMLGSTPHILFAPPASPNQEGAPKKPSNPSNADMLKWSALATAAILATTACLYGSYKLVSYFWSKNKKPQLNTFGEGDYIPSQPLENSVFLSPHNHNPVKGLSGYVKTNHGNIPASIIKVKNQFDSDGGGKASCGYHVVKNLKILSRGLIENKPIAEDLLSGNLVTKLFGKNNTRGSWRTFVINTCNDCDKNGEWIGESALESLANKENELNKMAGIPLEQPLKIYAFTNPEILTNSTYDWITPKVADTLRQSRNTEYTVGIAINNAHEYEKELPPSNWWHSLLCLMRLSKKKTQTDGTDGHWIGILIHQDPDGHRHYFGVDSTNNMRLDDDRLKKFVTAVERRMRT